MSQPKRYSLRLPDISYGTEENTSGEFVRYADYAALQAGNERLKETCEITFGRIDALFIRLRELQAENDCLRAAAQQLEFKEMDYIDEVSRLKAENERLNERLMYLEATRPRDPNHGGKVYEMPIDEEYYANLQLENKRLQSNIFGRDDTIARLDSIIKCRDEENERLRKAGDALCESPYLYETDQAVIAWRAAKGVQP